PDTSPGAKLQRDAHDIWGYQAISAIVRGHALLESFPEIDKERIGATGISWGGYLSTMIAGFDPKLKVVVPVFGCGFFQEHGAWEELLNKKMTNKNMRKWVALFDPSSHTQHAHCAMMFANGINDSHFPMNTMKKSALQCQGPVTMCHIMQIVHQHRWDIREVEPFVDSVIDYGTPFLQVSRIKRENQNVSATYNGPVDTRRATLVFTCDSGPWRPRVWDSTPAQLDTKTHTISASLPQTKKVTAFYLMLTDERGFNVSTLHEENND
ncbi:MAG: prolyl oligopeptidase family serine peptidase, partial [Verrucomicrobiaceae bacterium]